MEYKVWISLEQCDEDADQYDDLDLPFASVCTFDTMDEASTFASALQEQGKELARQAHYFSREAMGFYRHLADGLSDMIEEGRLASLRQEDYKWLVDELVRIAAADPDNPGYHTKPPEEGE